MPSECFNRGRYLPQPLRLLPAGATVAGRDSHPLGKGAFHGALSQSCWQRGDIQIPDPKQPVTPETFTFSLRRDKLRTVRQREGRYLLRSNLRDEDPATLWQYYIRLTEIEQAFKELKHDLAIRPIYHQTDKHIEAHIFIAFIAYCLHVTLKQHARSCAPGLTPRAVLEKFATMQMVDVHLPTTDGRELVLPRYTQPDPDHQLLFQQLKLRLPAQPPPRICV